MKEYPMPIRYLIVSVYICILTSNSIRCAAYPNEHANSLRCDIGFCDIPDTHKISLIDNNSGIVEDACRIILVTGTHIDRMTAQTIYEQMRKSSTGHKKTVPDLEMIFATALLDHEPGKDSTLVALYIEFIRSKVILLGRDLLGQQFKKKISLYEKNEDELISALIWNSYQPTYVTEPIDKNAYTEAEKRQARNYEAAFHLVINLTPRRTSHAAQRKSGSMKATLCRALSLGKLS